MEWVVRGASDNCGSSSNGGLLVLMCGGPIEHANRILLALLLAKNVAVVIYAHITPSLLRNTCIPLGRYIMMHDASLYFTFLYAHLALAEENTSIHKPTQRLVL